MATRAVLTPGLAEYPASAYPGLTISNLRPVLAYDDTTAEIAYWTFVIPQGWTGTKTCEVYYKMASATSGTVEWEVSVEAVTDADATDLDATTSFDTANSGSATVPGTAGYLDVISVTLTNNDSSAAGDYVRIRIARDADDGTNDTATGDAHLLFAEIRDGA